MISRISILFRQLNFLTAVKILFYSIFRRIFNSSVQNSYSECGDDIIIENLLKNRENGFYLDIGSNHPIKRSNTFKLYCNGWKGICVEPQKELNKLHKKIRPKDIVLSNPISNEERTTKFYKFSFDLVSTIEESLLESYKETYGDIEYVTEVKSTRLDTILKDFAMTHNCPIPNIDLLSIDVEGHDFSVLESLDLRLFKPYLIVIEMQGFNIENAKGDKIFQYLKNYNYRLVAVVGVNSYFVNQTTQG